MKYYKATVDLLIKNKKQMLGLKIHKNIKFIPLNADGYKVMELLQTPIPYEKLTENLGLSQNDPSLLSFLDKLIELGAVAEAETIQKLSSYPEFVKRETDAHVPVERLYIETTLKCNLRCSHCYQDFNSMIADDDIPFEKIAGLIDSACEAGIWAIDITGGEFFCRKDALKILEYIHIRKFLVNIYTNGTLLTEEIVSEMDRFDNIKYFNISLQYENAVKQEAFNKRSGSFDKILRSIKLLKEHGREVVINITAFSDNLESLDNVLKLVEQLDCSYRLAPVIPSGRGKKYIKDNAKIIAEKMLEMKVAHTDNSLSLEAGYSYPSQNFCGVGESFIFIESNGNIALCPTLCSRESKEFAVGSILGEYTLNSIWDNHDMLKRFRAGRCEKDHCEFYSDCAGGCRSSALLADPEGRSFSLPDYMVCTYYEVKKDMGL